MKAQRVKIVKIDEVDEIGKQYLDMEGTLVRNDMVFYEIKLDNGTTCSFFKDELEFMN